MLVLPEVQVLLWSQKSAVQRFKDLEPKVKMKLSVGGQVSEPLYGREAGFLEDCNIVFGFMC